MRIAALWKHEENGERWTSGEISSEVGINLPPGVKLLCKVVKNEKKVAGDNFPDFYLEAWFPRPRPQAAPETSAEAAEADFAPF
jgi:hypothetical protein